MELGQKGLLLQSQLVHITVINESLIQHTRNRLLTLLGTDVY